MALFNAARRTLKSTCATLFCLALILVLHERALFADQIFDARGFDPHRPFFSQLPFEHIDPLTGNVLLTFTDLVLPSNAGFDLRIQRTYNSKIYRDYQNLGETLAEDSWAGVGWTLHFGRVFNGLGTDVAPPVIEMPDGSQHQTFHHISPPSGCTACYVTREFWIYNKNTSTLTLPNGTTYTFGHSGTAGSGTALYATAIADAFGNGIAITYMSDPSDGIASVTQDLGGGQTRQVTFTVEPSRKSLSTMTFLGRTWTYTQTAIAEVGFSVLASAAPPIGPGWSYTYQQSSPGKYEMAGLTTPNGGQITYAYAEQTFRLGSTIPIRTVSMTQRTIGGRDITAGSWAYAYAQGSGQNQTIVTGPCNVTTYTFLGVGNYSSQGAAWAVGLPSSSTISDGGTLETEQLTWIASMSISNDRQIIGFNVDYGIYVPLVATRVVTRGPASFSTTNTYVGSNFNDYGRPSQVSESGQLMRSTSRTFQYGFSPYIVDKIASETVTVGGESFAKSYAYNLTNGFLQSQTIYGVTTTFSPTAQGNVAISTDARSKTTFFSYQWGRASSVQTPEHTISRSINSDGTIASETRRGFTTSFSYDALERLTQTT